MKISIVTPVPPGSQSGNRVTARRWSKLLRALGHRVHIIEEYDYAQTDMLIALHALKSHKSIIRYRKYRPDAPLVVGLTGTDLYHDLKRSAKAKKSLKLADRLVLLQPHGLSFLPKAARSKARVIFQSAVKPKHSEGAFKTRFEVCVIGHLRDVKDPFRTALAGRCLPADSRIHITQIGAALSESMARRAEQETKRQKRYRWTGEKPRSEAIRIMQQCRLLVVSSKSEGGPNIASEALACSVPILSSYISGMIGMLGEDYPGYFPVGDHHALADLMFRCERDNDFYLKLLKANRALLPLVNPKREKESWRKLVAELK